MKAQDLLCPYTVTIGIDWADSKHDVSNAIWMARFTSHQIASAPEAVREWLWAVRSRAMLASIDWVGHGFEIVQSIFPGWKFSAPDTVAAFGLHGALLIGPRYSIAAHAEDWDRMLATFEIDLKRNGAIADHGRAMNVLGGPVSALRHLVDILAGDQINPPLAPGEIVTTGTLTRALPVSAGETWTTELAGVALDGLSVRLS